MTSKRKILPSYERLHELFYYYPGSGLLIRKITVNNNGGKIHNVAGTPIATGHLKCAVDGDEYLVHRIAWKMMLNEEPPEEIDHKDTDGSNNKWENLREADRNKNMSNTNLYCTNTSGYKGVDFFKPAKLWRARIMQNYENITIGYFKTKEEAIIARTNYATKVRGEFARETANATPSP